MPESWKEIAQRLNGHLQGSQLMTAQNASQISKLGSPRFQLVWCKSKSLMYSITEHFAAFQFDQRLQNASVDVGYGKTAVPRTAGL